MLDCDMHHQALTIRLFNQSNEAPRCQAESKRRGVQCRKAAMRGKKICRMHGGASTEPKTLEGRETRAIRSKCDAKLRELRDFGLILKDFGPTP